MFLTGTFSEYPFFQLLEILLHKRETGLLEVSCPQQCGRFYVKNGEIKGGEVGNIRGTAAIELASTFENGSFKFNRLDSTEYARLVWEESFGPHNTTAENGSFRVRPILKQFRSYPIAAYGVLENVFFWLARALPQLLVYFGSVYRSLEKLGVLIVRRTFSFTQAKHVDFLSWEQHGGSRIPALHPALSEQHDALRHYLEILLKQARVQNLQIKRGLVLIRTESAVLWSLSATVFSRAMRELRSYEATAGRNLKDARISIAGRTRVYVATMWQSSKTVVPTFRRVEAVWQIALRRTKQLIIRTARILNFQKVRALIQERRAQTNVSFAMIVVVLLVGTTVSITKILRSNHEPNNVVSTKEESVGSYEAPQKVPRRRVKRKRRIGKQTSKKKQKVKATETALVKQAVL
jgi:hypothetical protein